MNKNIKKISTICLISIILTIIYELIMSLIFKTKSNFIIDKIFIESMIMSFILLHCSIGITKLYDFIIKHRYKIAIIMLILLTLLQYSGSSNGLLASWVLEPEKDNTIIGAARNKRSDEYALETLLAISQGKNDYEYKNSFIRGIATDVFSVAHAPVKDILSIGRLYNLGYIILNNPGMGLAFNWNLKCISLILVTFELLYLLTNKDKKISVIGTIMVFFSGFMQWWSIVDIIIYGELAIVLLDKFLVSNDFKIRCACLAGITISAISYVFTLYPAYMVAFGYVFLALAIWVIIKNRKEYKISKKDIIPIILSVGSIAFLGYRYWYLSQETLNIISNTSYPGKRLENGGGGIPYLFSYLYNFLLPYIDTVDNCSVANIISIYPIPMIIGIYYLYKEEKHVSFLLPISIVAVLETVFCVSGLPQILSNITLLKYTTIQRIVPAIGFANFYILLYILANIDEEIVSMKISIRISLLAMCIVAFIPLPVEFSTKGYLLLISGTLCLLSFLFLNSSDKRYKKVLLSILLLLSLIGGVLVNPITKGVGSVQNTNIAKKIQEISNEDKDALWVTLENFMTLSNYAMANGAKTINTTNLYPNEELFVEVLGKEKAEELENIWNRYSHIEVMIDKENTVELVSKDKISLHITTETLKNIGIKYIITYSNKKKLEDEVLKLEEVYKHKNSEEIKIEGVERDTIYIYEVM